jgi:hypothetical protein
MRLNCLEQVKAFLGSSSHVKWALIFKKNFVGFALKGKDYGMVATSFGLSSTLFKFSLINLKHKLLIFEIVLNNYDNLKLNMTSL